MSVQSDQGNRKKKNVSVNSRDPDETRQMHWIIMHIFLFFLYAQIFFCPKYIAPDKTPFSSQKTDTVNSHYLEIQRTL